MAVIYITLTGVLSPDAVAAVATNANGLPMKVIATFDLNGTLFSYIPQTKFDTSSKSIRIGFASPQYPSRP